MITMLETASCDYIDTSYPPPGFKLDCYRVCDECNGKMFPAVIDQKFNFNGKSIVLKGLNVFKCEKCGNVVYSFEKATMIDRLIRQE